MKNIGGTMFFFGVGSAVLYFLHMEFVLLAWIDLWGPTVGWIIRGALTVVGGVLWLIGLNADGSAETQPGTTSTTSPTEA